jgi:hypothetical protein
MFPDRPAETPSYPTMEGGVSVSASEYGLWWITSLFAGMSDYDKAHFMEDLNEGLVAHFPARCMTYGNGRGFAIFLQATDPEMVLYLERFKRTVELWNMDIRYAKVMRVAYVRNP